MLRRLGAVLLAVGLCLPYSCSARPIAQVWQAGSFADWLLIGLPVIVAVAYVLHVALPPLARFHERNGALLHGVFRMVYFALAGATLYAALTGERRELPFYAAAIVVTGGLLAWQQRRGTKAQRLPMLLLIVSGLPAVSQFLAGLNGGGLEIGAWVLTAGYVVAVTAEVMALRGAPPISHGG